MKASKVILTAFSLVYCINLNAQGLDALLKDDYDKRGQMLIQSELRKTFGSNMNSPSVQKVTRNLLPWAMLEGYSPEIFARAVKILHDTELAGIPFESNEDLLPLLPGFRGTSEDFLFISRFAREAEAAQLPAYHRDDLISKAVDRNWDGQSVLYAGRLLILSRRENINTRSYIDTLAKSVPAKVSKLSKAQTDNVTSRLTSNFSQPTTRSLVTKIQSDTEELKKAKGDSVPRTLAITARNFDYQFEQLGSEEFRRRPKVTLTPEDLGIETPGTVPPTTVPGRPPVSQTQTFPGSQPSPGNQSNVPTQSISPTHNNNPTQPIGTIPPQSSQGMQTGAIVPVGDWRNLAIPNLERAVAYWLGTKYKFGGSTKQGIDCSAFVQNSLTSEHVQVPQGEIPRTSALQSKIGADVARSNMRPGDLIFFSASPNQSKITHVGIVMQDRKFSHASSSRGVVIQGVDEKWWKDRYVLTRRIFQSVR